MNGTLGYAQEISSSVMTLYDKEKPHNGTYLANIIQRLYFCTCALSIQYTYIDINSILPQYFYHKVKATSDTLVK